MMYRNDFMLSNSDSEKFQKKNAINEFIRFYEGSNKTIKNNFQHSTIHKNAQIIRKNSLLFLLAHFHWKNQKF